MKRVSAFICSMALTASLSGQEVVVTALPDTSSILLGDQIHFKLSAEIPSGASINLPVIHDTLTAKILILGRPERDTLMLRNGMKKVTDSYLITSFDEGSYSIAPIPCIVNENGIIKTYLSEASALNVIRPAVAPADTTDVIYDIIGPRKAPVIFMEVLPWIIIGLVAVLILWLLLKFLPRNPLAKFLKKEKPAVPAHITAFRELDNLRKDELWQKGEIKEYYSRLSDILRRYIDGRFGIQSPELTTDETVRKLQKSKFVSNDVLAVVKNILSDADMVKFAKYKPGDDINNISIDKATEFITVTKPAEIVSEDNSEAEKKGGKK